jgi:hypothetical protein
VRKSETRRERIQVVNENGKLQVINSLGAPIKSLWVADADMNVYQATNVAAGQKAGLIPIPGANAVQSPASDGLWRKSVSRPTKTGFGKTECRKIPAAGHLYRRAGRKSVHRKCAGLGRQPPEAHQKFRGGFWNP